MTAPLRFRLAATALSACLVLGAAPAPAQSEPTPLTPARIVSINPAHPSETDLAPILEAIGDARIVVLASATDGDGATNWARSRLAHALVKEAGFSVIAFEAGYYDCWAMNQQFAAGTDASIVPPTGLPDQFAKSGYLTSVFRDVWRSYFDPQPTDLCGFDYRHTGNRTARQLPRSLLEYFDSIDPNPLTKDQRREYLTVLERLADALESDDDDAAVRSWEELHELDRVLAEHEAALVDSGGQALFETWHRVLADAVLNAEDALASDIEDKTLAAEDARQEHMGEQLVRLANEVYTGRRVIVFASTLTTIADPAGIRVEPDADLLGGYQSAGTRWRDAFGEDLYTIAFTAERGISGWIRGPGFPVPDAVAGSVEARLAAERWPFLFLPLRGNPDPWWNSVRPSTLTGLSRVLAYRESLPREQRVSAVWPGQIDAVFYIEQMFPNHWRAEPPEGVPDTVNIE